MDYTRYTLAQIDALWRDDRIGLDDVLRYLSLWNKTAMRFTVAYLQDGAIRQRHKRDDE